MGSDYVCRNEFRPSNSENNKQQLETSENLMSSLRCSTATMEVQKDI